MNDVPPELAGKVVDASMRNLMKEVSEGAVPSPANRQMFLALASIGNPSAIQKARETALIMKHLAGGRLSKEERQEIAHILGEGRQGDPAKLPSAETPTPTQPRPAVVRGPDDYGHLAISRRTYYRWKKFGEQVPAGADLPPFDQPELLPEWYERMRTHGFFKHRFPGEIAEAIERHVRSSPGQPAKVDAREKKEQPPQSVPNAFHGREHGAAQGLIFEVEAEQRRVASLRVARDEAYANGERREGDDFDRRYREALDALSLVQQRALKIAEQEGRLVPVDMVAEELAPKIAAIVQGGLLLWDRVGAQIMEAGDHAARRKVWKTSWIEFCKTLVEGRFAPPLSLIEPES